MRAPKNNYDFSEKKEYRETVWRYFAKHLDPQNSVIALMPSKNGDEIVTALNYGFKEENLIAIDENPAEIATSIWRKKFPNVKFYGNKLSRAGIRIKNDGIRLDAINMDLCNNLSFELFEEVSEFLKSGCLSPESLLSLTVLRGREASIVNVISTLYTNHINGNLSEVLGKRIGILFSVLLNMNSISLEPMYTDVYTSGSKTMRYAIIKICTSKWHEERNIEELDELYHKYIQKVLYYHKCLRFCLHKLCEDWHNYDIENFQIASKDDPHYISPQRFDGIIKKKGLKAHIKKLNEIYFFWRECIIMYAYLYFKSYNEAYLSFYEIYGKSFKNKYYKKGWSRAHFHEGLNTKKGQIVNQELVFKREKLNGYKKLLGIVYAGGDSLKEDTNAYWSIQEHEKLNIPFEYFTDDPEI